MKTNKKTPQPNPNNLFYGNCITLEQSAFQEAAWTSI